MDTPYRIAAAACQRRRRRLADLDASPASTRSAAPQRRLPADWGWDTLSQPYSSVTAPATLVIESSINSVRAAAPTRSSQMLIRFPRPSDATLVSRLGFLMALVAGAAGTADGQRAGGSIGVSLTILESVETRAVGITGFRLERDGRATVETTAPIAGKIVMARVASSANGFQPVEQAPVLLRGDRGEPGPATPWAGSQRITHRVDVGRATGGSGPRDVQLRIEYLVVAGT